MKPVMTVKTNQPKQNHSHSAIVIITWDSQKVKVLWYHSLKPIRWLT